MGDYFLDKSKMYYEKYKSGKLTKKVDCVIKVGNKYLTIIRENKRPMFIGGSVEENETTKMAAIREIFEECGGKVVKLKYLTKYYYSVDWEYQGITFPNKRVTYIYLCEIEKDNLKIKGLDGEFDKNEYLKWCTSDELEKLGMWEHTLKLVKKIEKENINI